MSNTTYQEDVVFKVNTERREVTLENKGTLKYAPIVARFIKDMKKGQKVKVGIDITENEEYLTFIQEIKGVSTTPTTEKVENKEEVITKDLSDLGLETIYHKLFYVQQNLKAPKNKKNTFAHFKYRSCEDILELLKPILSDVNAIINLSDEIVNVGDKNYIKATATLIDAENGKSHSVSAYARESAEKKGMDDAQMTGTSSSYARKYALSGLFAIDDNDDIDSMENK